MFRRALTKGKMNRWHAYCKGEMTGGVEQVIFSYTCRSWVRDVECLVKSLLLFENTLFLDALLETNYVG